MLSVNCCQVVVDSCWLKVWTLVVHWSWPKVWTHIRTNELWMIWARPPVGPVSSSLGQLVPALTSYNCQFKLKACIFSANQVVISISFTVWFILYYVYSSRTFPLPAGFSSKLPETQQLSLPGPAYKTLRKATWYEQLFRSQFTFFNLGKWGRDTNFATIHVFTLTLYEIYLRENLRNLWEHR